MSKYYNFIFGAKCAPEESLFSDIKKAGLKAVELYLSKDILKGLTKIIDLCKGFNFSYAVHAPKDEYNPNRLSKLVKSIGAKIVIFHDSYWEDEWKNIIKIFKKIDAKICIENISSENETVKFMRRYGLGRCLDLEHLQIECAGIYEDEFVRVMRGSSHVHLSGYVYGSCLWHTQAHQSKENSFKLLNLLKAANYSGFVISEARLSQQTYLEFKKLNDFFMKWETKCKTQ